jgi:hypothetical protein
MISPRRGPIPSELGPLIDELDDVQRRLRQLEAPSGEQLAQVVEELEALVNDIQAQLDDYIANDAYTKAQVDAKVASPGAIAPTTITASGAVQLNSTLRVPNAYAFDITYTRRTGWWGDDGRAGYASSSARKKTAIEPADEERLARLLDLVPKTFYYRAEIARRTSRRINEGIDYVPAKELGLIAEELDALGLREFVYYDDEGRPEGIEYSMLAVALLAVARAQHVREVERDARVDALAARLARLEGVEG